MIGTEHVRQRSKALWTCTTCRRSFQQTACVKPFLCYKNIKNTSRGWYMSRGFCNTSMVSSQSPKLTIVYPGKCLGAWENEAGDLPPANQWIATAWLSEAGIWICTTHEGAWVSVGAQQVPCLLQVSKLLQDGVLGRCLAGQSPLGSVLVRIGVRQVNCLLQVGRLLQDGVGRCLAGQSPLGECVGMCRDEAGQLSPAST